MNPPIGEWILRWLPVAVFAALPTVGLVEGPSYAALVFGLGGTQFLYVVAVQRARPSIDPVPLGLAIAFACLCWASVIWSIAPDRSWHGALQVTAVFAASIVVLGGPVPSVHTRDILFRSMQIAFAVGAAIILVDGLTGYHLQSFLAGGKYMPLTKYNRGADYFLLIVWPVLAWASSGRKWPTIFILVLSIATVMVFTIGATGHIAALVGLIVLGLSLLSRRFVSIGLTAATVVLAIFMPLLTRFLAEFRSVIVSLTPVGSHLRVSGLHRLELWDYMSARVFERPFLGWGVATAKALPIRADELSHYLYATAQGNYPHNQWLQLWVETGLGGAAIALALALLTLVRIRSLPPKVQPFAYATFASAFVISLADFQITTDSWWAALAACAYLFAVLRQQSMIVTNRQPAPSVRRLAETTANPSE